jgi:hypothetical protein
MKLVTFFSGMGVAAIALSAVSGCGSNERDEKIREVLERSAVTLHDAIAVAEARGGDRAAVRAQLLLASDPLFSVTTFEVERLEDVRIDLEGSVVTTIALGQTTTGPCGGITLAEAIAVAEEAAGGEAVAIVPDDDDPFMSEVQVFTDTLWEVKVASDGSVVEQELSDENLSGGEDEEED